MFVHDCWNWYEPANGAYGGQAGRVVVEVDVGEHEGEAEVRVVVTGVESLQIFVLKERIYQQVLGQL